MSIVETRIAYVVILFQRRSAESDLEGEGESGVQYSLMPADHRLHT